MFFGVKNCLKNWNRVHKEHQANSILLKVHEMASERNLPWPVMTKQHLESIGIRPDSEVENLHKVAFEKLKEKFHQDSFEEIKSDRSKLRTYSKVKTETGMEDYLNSVKNLKGRTALTKIRLSNHDLMIEKGRHQGLQENDRLCPFCENTVENEHHFIMQCSTYDSLRQNLFIKISEAYNQFTVFDDYDKFIFLLSNCDVAKQMGEYLDKTLELRRFLTENPKQNG